MMTTKSKIIYTQTDEAPALATYSFLPIVQAFTASADIEVETRDISLAARILCQFPECLSDEQKVSDTLAELGVLAKKPEANIIKLPNISASIPQLKEALKELQSHGYKLPDFPEDLNTDEDKANRAKFAKALGSAVNPVLREGNSDRRVAAPVKQYAKDNPHSMGEWKSDSKSHVAHMSEGDFYSSEQSVVIDADTDVKIEFVDTNNKSTTLKESTPLLAGEVIDGSRMSVSSLRNFLEKETQAAKSDDVLLSLHMKATMMKVSDPIIFGEAVKVYYKEVFNKYASTFEELGVDARNGIGDVYNKIQT
jgi:isocitrate dehydrogenase